MPRMRIDIEGEKEMLGTLKQLDAATQTTALVSALSAGLALVQVEASRLAPRSTTGSRGNPAGHLAANIGAEVNLAAPTKAVGRVAPEKDAWYGIFAELGTRDHPPTPFLRPAIDNTKDEVERAVGGVLRDFIVQAVR